MSEFIWDDPDDGLRYVMRYVVTQHEDEGPEYVEWRYANSNDPWQKLPPWATPPAEAMEFWHGPVITHELVTEFPKTGEGCILVMKDGPLSTDTGTDALCITENMLLFWADLAEFTFVSHESGEDEVAPGDVIKTLHPHWVEGARQLRDWLQL